MDARPRPTFGKRNPPSATTRKRLPAEDPHRAFFAAVRAERGQPEFAAAGAALEVPRSLRAALLAGLVVGCGLAGIDATARLAALRGLTDALPEGSDVRLLAPALILLAVVGGGRAAATSLLAAHWVLARLGRTEHLAYAGGGAVAAGAFAALLLVVLGQPSAHGVVVDVLAGAAGGFFYRVFAGTRPAEPRRAS